MKNVVFIFVFLSLLSCATQQNIQSNLIVNKWKYLEFIGYQKAFISTSLSNNKYSYHFFNNGNVSLFHTDTSILEKYKNLEGGCLNDYLQMINSLPKINLYGKWQVSDGQILKIEYNFKGKVFNRMMKIAFVSKAYLDVELLE